MGGALDEKEGVVGVEVGLEENDGVFGVIGLEGVVEATAGIGETEVDGVVVEDDGEDEDVDEEAAVDSVVLVVPELGAEASDGFSDAVNTLAVLAGLPEEVLGDAASLAGTVELVDVDVAAVGSGVTTGSILSAVVSEGREAAGIDGDPEGVAA